MKKATNMRFYSGEEIFSFYVHGYKEKISKEKRASSERTTDKLLSSALNQARAVRKIPL